jgi:hypothetical protein
LRDVAASHPSVTQGSAAVPAGAPGLFVGGLLVEIYARTS